ncbi:hypothetical protein G5714_005619 [Onychostoma macrolepis]|uniref:ADP-ribosylation factor-like protein 15 n=1 Tax=Onychostoma macrolepis TaxID=369639 RepID=A0A7J6D1M0_9TELE|nr:hypothetical protein G5714_005619 [Onychostoma macrolepis]
MRKMIYVFTSRDTPSRSVKDEPDACGFGKEIHVGSGMQKSFEVPNSVTVKAMAMGDAQRPEYDVVCIGLSGAGKTSLLSRLCNEISDGTVPTTGFSIKAVPFENVILNVKELGGAETIKKYWSRYYQGSQGVVFVLNSATSDEEMELSRSELLSAMQHPQLCTLPFLILANHQDSPAARSVSEIQKYLELQPLARGKRWILAGSTTNNMKAVKESFSQLIRLLEEKETTHPIYLALAKLFSGLSWNTNSINQCQQQLHLTSPCPPGLSPPTVCGDSSPSATSLLAQPRSAASPAASCWLPLRFFDLLFLCLRLTLLSSLLLLSSRSERKPFALSFSGALLPFGHANGAHPQSRNAAENQFGLLELARLSSEEAHRPIAQALRPGTY